MDSTQIECPFCGAKKGKPCVPAREQDDGPMNHVERHVAWQDQQEVTP